ncbi:MAG TPA: hypothetical protein VFU43_25320 [Streptosporangiaceae bacterium]|nr:hypothetical protein [Streptosporangiaceae bacterium]
MSVGRVPAQSVPGSPLRQRLRAALLAAMRSRDRLTVGVMRSALAAIDNAEAVEVPAAAGEAKAIEHSPVGVGAAELERRALTEADVERIVRAEAAAREAAARDYDAAGAPERAESLRAEARVLLEHVDGVPGEGEAAG